MRHVVLILLGCFITFVFADWESIGPDGGPIEYVVASLEDPNVLYACSGNYPARFVASDDGGLTWSRAGDCPGYSYSLGIGPNDVVYCGGIHTIHISTDGAQTWTETTVSSAYILDIAPHPTDELIIHATGFRYESGTYYMQYIESTDGGSSWSVTDLDTDAKGSTIAFSASAPETIYLGGYNPASWGPILYKSTDGGGSFTDITPAAWSSDYETHSIAVHPNDPDILCVSNRYHMYRSSDGGSSWTEVESSTIYDLAWSTVDTDVIYGSGDNYVWYSTDGGFVWNQSSTPESGRYESIVTSTAVSTDAWTGSAPGLCMTTDGGTSWNAVTEGMNIGTVAALVSAYSDPSRMYLSMVDVGIFLTDNSGEVWTKLDTLLDCGDICAFAVSNTNSDYVYALEGAG